MCVTGVGSGLGKALSLEFLSRGHRVIGVARSRDAFSHFEPHESSKSFVPCIADLTELSATRSAIERACAEWGIDVLFNNAAIYPKSGFLEVSIDEWFSAIEVNVGGVAACCHAVLPFMIDQKFGRIYNVGSWADRTPIENSSGYATSKGGLHALTKAIAADIEALDMDIEIHEWIPGHLNTRMSEFTGIDPAISARWGADMVMKQASRKNSVFENDSEWFPPKPLRQRVLNLLRLRR